MENAKLRRSLTVFPLVLFGLAYMAPTTVFSTYGVVAEITKGMVPAAYIIACLVYRKLGCAILLSKIRYNSPEI